MFSYYTDSKLQVRIMFKKAALGKGVFLYISHWSRNQGKKQFSDDFRNNSLFPAHYTLVKSNISLMFIEKNKTQKLPKLSGCLWFMGLFF